MLMSIESLRSANPIEVASRTDEGGGACMIYHRTEVYPSTSITDVPEVYGLCPEEVSIVSIIKDRETAYKIEEQIEEITTTTTADDDEEDQGEEEMDATGDGCESVDSMESSKRYHRRDQTILEPYGLDLSSSGCARVAFPELGLDIMDLNYANEDELLGENCDQQVPKTCENGKVKIVDAYSWQENWLFQKKRKSENEVVPIYCLLNLFESTDPVCMLIPNPSQFSPPTIGSLSIDQLSDLTERNSVGSLEFSDSEEEEADEEVEEVEAENLPTSPSKSNGKLQVKSVSSNALSSPSSAYSTSSSPFPASSLSSSSYTVNNNRNTSTINCPRNAKSKQTDTLSAPLPPLKIPDFIGINKRPSNLDYNHPGRPFSEDPMFTLTPQPANVQSDILVQFCCRVKGSLPLGVAWYRNGLFIGGTIEKGKSSSELGPGYPEEGDKSTTTTTTNKIDVNTKDFRTFKHFTDHILEIKSTRVDLSGHYSTCVYNHFNQHWIDFKVTINPMDYNQPNNVQPIRKLTHQKMNGSNPPPIKQRFTKSHSQQLDKERRGKGVSIISEKLHGEGGGYDEVDHESMTGPKPGTIAEREHRKWEESPVAWPENPYTIENVTKRKHYLDSLEGQSPESVNKVEDDDEANLHALPYISPSKDMERYRRDYYVPNVPKEHETCNAVDEKIYSSCKYFTSSPTNNHHHNNLQPEEDEDHHPQQVRSESESTLDEPDVKSTSCKSEFTFFPTESNVNPGLTSPRTITSSPSSSASSSTPAPARVISSSSVPRVINEHHLTYKHAEAEVLENLGNITSLVSVKELINRFSHLRESTTNGSQYRSCNNQINLGQNSLNRYGTLINGATGIKPRLITDGDQFHVPFKIVCWTDDDEIGLNGRGEEEPHVNHEEDQEGGEKLNHNNQQEHLIIGETERCDHDENDNRLNHLPNHQPNDQNYQKKRTNHAPSNGPNGIHGDTQPNRIKGRQAKVNHNNNCDDDLTVNIHDVHLNGGEHFYETLDLEKTSSNPPTLLSPPPPVLPPKVQPRGSTTSSSPSSSLSPCPASKTKSNRTKFTPVKPHHPLAVNSITGRCLNKEYRNWSNAKNNQKNHSSTNLMGSLSLYDLNSSELSGRSESSNPESPAFRSPSNEGYISDDSNLSERIDGRRQSTTPFGGKKVVRRMAPSIMKRASFWEKRCEQEMSPT